MLFKVILWVVILFFIIRFVLRFVTPLLQISRITQDRLKQMQQQMDDMHQNNNRTRSQESTKAKKGEYIDYEEV